MATDVTVAVTTDNKTEEKTPDSIPRVIIV